MIRNPLSAHFGEPQNPQNLQNLFMLAKSYQVTLFLNLTALHFRGRWHSKGMTERAKYVVHFRFLLAKPSQATTPPALPKGRAQKTIKPHCARRNAPPLVLRTTFPPEGHWSDGPHRDSWQLAVRGLQLNPKP